MDSEDTVRAGVGDDLHEPVRIAVGLGAAVREHRELARLDLDAFGAEVFLRAPDGGDLGIGVDDARDHIVIDDADLTGEDLGDRNALILRLVSKHRAGGYVADRVYAVDAGAEVVIDLDLAAVVGPNACRFEVEPVGIRPA